MVHEEVDQDAAPGVGEMKNTLEIRLSLFEDKADECY